MFILVAIVNATPNQHSPINLRGCLLKVSDHQQRFSVCLL